MRCWSTIRTLAVLVAVAQPALWGQHFSFQTFSEEQGLNNLSVATMLQDQTGFLWIGTENGLFRFDGHQFLGYGRDQGLTDSMVYALHQTSDGVIWVGSSGGLFRFDGKRFLHQTPELAQGPGKPIVWEVKSQLALASDSGGRLWAATTHGLLTGLPQGDATHSRRFQYFTHPLLPPGQPTACVHVDPQNVVWFSSNKLLYRLKGEKLEVLGAPNGLPGEDWTSILTDGAGRLWVRSNNHLMVLNRGAGQFLPMENGFRPEARAYLTSDGGEGVLITSNHGLGRWTGTRWSFYDESNGLPSQTVCCVLHDREGSRWVGLRGAGLARWRNPELWESWTRAEGLQSDEVYAIDRDPEGKILVGTNVGLDVLPELSNRNPKPMASPVPTGDGIVTSIAKSSDGSVWLARYPGGVTHIQPRQGRPQRLGKESGLASENTLAVFVDRSQRLWVGTTEGVFRADALGTPIRFERVRIDAESETEMFHQFAQDQDGAIWAAGRHGLSRLLNNRWTRFKTAQGLLGDHVAGVTATSNHEIWIYYGQRPGVSRIRLDSADKLQVANFSRTNGLHSELVTQVATDQRGWIWVAGERGVDLFSGKPGAETWSYFNRAHGLVWNDCNSNAFYADSDGSVWIGTSKGLAHFRPPTRAQLMPPPPVVITSARWGSHILTPGQTSADSSTFRYEQSPLVISFAGLTFTNEAPVHFRYHLIGLQDEWVDTDQQEVPFASLPAGEYTFEVIARSARQVWSTVPARVSLHIRPPFWQTWWFGLLVTALVVLAAGRIWAWRISHLLKIQLELEQAVQTRTQELEAEKHDLLIAREKLQILATRDSLTGLWNRRTIFEILDEELAKARQSNLEVAVIMADLDGFKKINDIHGHHIGDLVLQHTAKRILSCLRHTDSVGRYGGEELLIVLPNCPGTSAATRAEMLRRALASEPLSLPVGNLTVTSSFGVNWTRSRVFDGPALVKDADAALYKAKHSGRNRVEMAEAEAELEMV